MTEMERYHFDDLTKINVPFGLLDDDTQERLKAWPHGWEVYVGHKDMWEEFEISIHNLRGCSYRAKPAPLTKPHVPDDVWRVMPDEKRLVGVILRLRKKWLLRDLTQEDFNEALSDILKIEKR